MSGKEPPDALIASRLEYKDYVEFVKHTDKIGHNFSFYPSPNNTFSVHTKPEIKKEKRNFYEKYFDLSDQNLAHPFYLEEELAKQVKYWHSNHENYKQPILTQDNYFNEENVLSHLLKDIYIKRNPSVVTFDLIDYVITYLEKRVFEKVLMEGITSYQYEQERNGLIGPVLDKDFIEYLISYDIEEKLNILYKENSLGYSYIAEKIITFDLFIIYLILKNYPFYILRRTRLEKIFTQLKKFKSFPYPIGSIGMDLFKLLINELYLPGVTLFQEIRETFLLDIIDPKILEIDCDYFIKVVAFSGNDSILGMGYNIQNLSGNNNTNNNINNNTNTNNFKEKPKSSEKIGGNVKLHEIKELTFTSMGIYTSYILYSSDDQKDEKENSYLVDILALFEKRYKIKKEDIVFKENISEKNIINNLFNLIDNGLDLNFSTFSNNVRVINDKLILTTKEIHENTTNSPKDNINLRRFLQHKINFMNFAILDKTPKRFIPKKINYNINKKFELKKKTTLNLKKNQKKKNKNIQHQNNNINNRNNQNEENENVEEEEEDEEIKKKREFFNLIKLYKMRLDDEKNVNTDLILEDYVINFIKLKENYFKHLQQFDVENYSYETDLKKKEVLNYNIISKIKEKHLASLYKQKYLITEDQLLSFIKNLYIWKSNVNALYHKKLYEEYYTNLQAKKNKDNNNNKQELKNYILREIDTLVDNTSEIEKDYSNISLNDITKEKDELEKIIKSKLTFNHVIYLLPGFVDKALCKYIMKNDYIYKSTVGDLFMNFFNRGLGPDVENIIETPIQTYLREAKHYYNLKVFKCAIETKEVDKAYLKLNAYKYYYFIYGGVHIEATDDVKMILDDSRTINFSNDKKKLYIDIINLYNDGSEIEKNTGMSKRINNIEKYLVYPYTDKFQIFVSATKDNPNCNIENENQNQYFQKYVGNLINFDVKSMYYEARKILLMSDNFVLVPTFFEKIRIRFCTYFEICFDNEEKDLYNEDNDNKEENNDIDESEEQKEIQLILEEDKTTSFDVKISTFLDLNLNEN